jgi:branched-chain amino acid transport system permease protein
MLGAMLGLTFHVWWGQNIFITLLLVIVTILLLAILMELISVHPFAMAGSDVWIMSTLAVGMLMINGAQLIWGREPIPFPAIFGEDPVKILGIGIYPQEIVIVAAAFLIMIILEIFYKKTLTGKAIRATAFRFDTAALMGINITFIAILTYAISGCIAATAGVLIAPVTLVEATMGTILGIKAFGIAIIGGLESAKGIFICGLLYGVMEGLLSGYLYSGIRDIIGFSVVILILFIKPQGVFGKKVIEKV